MFIRVVQFLKIVDKVGFRFQMMDYGILNVVDRKSNFEIIVLLFSCTMLCRLTLARQIERAKGHYFFDII